MKTSILLVVYWLSGDIQPKMLEVNSVSKGCAIIHYLYNSKDALMEASLFQVNTDTIGTKVNLAIEPIDCPRKSEFDFSQFLQEAEKETDAELCRILAEGADWKRYFRCVADKVDKKISDKSK